MKVIQLQTDKNSFLIEHISTYLTYDGHVNCTLTLRNITTGFKHIHRNYLPGVLAHFRHTLQLDRKLLIEEARSSAKGWTA